MTKEIRLEKEDDENVKEENISLDDEDCSCQHEIKKDQYRED